MAIAKCSENGIGYPSIDFRLHEGGSTEKDQDVYISFELPWDCLPDEYDGANVGYFLLEDLIKDFLLEYWDNSHGEFTPRVIKLLREYADKIERDLKLRIFEKKLIIAKKKIERLSRIGNIVIKVEGSFNPNGEQSFSARTEGHAQAVADAIEYLYAKVLPAAIRRDRQLHDEGAKPEVGLGIGNGVHLEKNRKEIKP